MPDNPNVDNSETAPLRAGDWWIVLALAIAAALVFAFLFSQKFEGLRSNDQADYCQIARNLYGGEGFTTKALKPLELAFDARLERHPDYWRPPLYPLMICVAYALAGVKESAGVLVSGFFFILLAPAMYLFGRRMSGRTVGIAAAALVIFLPQMWDYSLHALTEMSFAFLLAALLYAIYVGANPFVTGLVFGLCYLHRYNTLVYLPAVLWFFLVIDRYKWRETGLFGVGALLVSLPWLIRNTVLTGNPMFSLQKYEMAMFTKTYPGYYLYATFDPVGPIAMLSRHFGDLVTKYTRGLNYLTGEIPLLTHPTVMLFFFASLLAFRIQRRLRFLLYTVCIMMVLQMHFVAIVHPLIRLFVPFIPVIALFSVIAFDRLLRLAPWPRVRPWLIGAAAFAVAATSVGKGWNTDYESIWSMNREEFEYLRQLPAGSVVVTDQPWGVAWKANLVSILAPVRYADFEERLSSSVDYAFFSGVPFEPAGPRSYREQYTDNPKFKEGFALEKRFDSGGVLFVGKRALGRSANEARGDDDPQE